MCAHAPRRRRRACARLGAPHRLVIECRYGCGRAPRLCGAGRVAYTSETPTERWEKRATPAASSSTWWIGVSSRRSTNPSPSSSSSSGRPRQLELDDRDGEELVAGVEVVVPYRSTCSLSRAALRRPGGATVSRGRRDRSRCSCARYVSPAAPTTWFCPTRISSSPTSLNLRRVERPLRTFSSASGTPNALISDSNSVVLLGPRLARRHHHLRAARAPVVVVVVVERGARRLREQLVVLMKIVVVNCDVEEDVAARRQHRAELIGEHRVLHVVQPRRLQRRVGADDREGHVRVRRPASKGLSSASGTSYALTFLMRARRGGGGGASQHAPEDGARGGADARRRDGAAEEVDLVAGEASDQPSMPRDCESHKALDVAAALGDGGGGGGVRRRPARLEPPRVGGKVEEEARSGAGPVDCSAASASASASPSPLGASTAFRRKPAASRAAAAALAAARSESTSGERARSSASSGRHCRSRAASSGDPAGARARRVGRHRLEHLGRDERRRRAARRGAVARAVGPATVGGAEERAEAEEFFDEGARVGAGWAAGCSAAARSARAAFATPGAARGRRRSRTRRTAPRARARRRKGSRAPQRWSR